MTHIVVIGAGITGVTTAYNLSQAGYRVTVIDRHFYPAMETSFANGGQLSACNAEVWNSMGTVFKGLKWMLKADAPLLVNPKPSWHKYSWMAEFVYAIRNYRQNTIKTTQLAIEARKHLFSVAEKENIQFDLEKRGILHFFHNKESFDANAEANKLLVEGGLERYSVTPEEIKSIEPTLTGSYYGGFYTPSDATGDIHKFTRGLSEACKKRGVRFLLGATLESLQSHENGTLLNYRHVDEGFGEVDADAVVICAGVGSRDIASIVGDRVNVYPVKGYSITVHLDDQSSVLGAPWTSLLDESAKIVTSRLGNDRFRVAGTAEFNGYNRDIRADRIAPLVEWTRKNFDISTARVTPWAGLRPMMPDMMPRVFKGSKPGVFYNTGHGHLGWTLSAITAASVTELVANHHPL